MAKKGVIVHSTDYEGVHVEIELRKAKKKGKDRIFIRIQGSQWELSYVQGSKHVGWFGFDRST